MIPDPGLGSAIWQTAIPGLKSWVRNEDPTLQRLLKAVLRASRASLWTIRNMGTPGSCQASFQVDCDGGYGQSCVVGDCEGGDAGVDT